MRFSCVTCPFSRVSVRRRLDVGRHLPGTLLRHLPTVEVETMADAVSRLQNDRGRVDAESHVECADPRRVTIEEPTRR